MVSKSFDINSGSLQPFEPSGKRLIVEVSPESVAVILWDKIKRIPEAVEIFKGAHGEAGDWDSMLQQSRLLGFRDLETAVIIAYPEMLLIPSFIYSPGAAKSQLELFFGNRVDSYTGGDILKEVDMVVAWQIPANVRTYLSNHFHVLHFQHLAGLLIANHKKKEGFEGHIVLYGNIGWVVLWKHGELQIAKSIPFLKPDDLSWHLLNVCEQFELELTGVTWKVSGMAEESSPLWQAISKFLDPVWPMDAGIPLQEALPKHYLSHLFVGL
jgi:hypothetical protein